MLGAHWPFKNERHTREEEGWKRREPRGTRRGRRAPTPWLACSVAPVPCALPGTAWGIRARLGAAVSAVPGREARALGSARPWAWTEGAGRAGGAAGLGGWSVEPDKGSGVALAPGARPGRWAPRLQDTATGSSAWSLSHWPASRTRTFPARFLSALRICGGDLSGSVVDPEPKVRCAPPGRGARERRKFPSRAQALGACERAIPGCSDPDQTGRRKHGQ